MARRAYVLLTDEEKDDTIVGYLLAQERDHFCHTINAERYAEVLAQPDLIEGPFKVRIEQLLSETADRLAEVELILEKTVPQLPPDPARVEAARLRLQPRV